MKIERDDDAMMLHQDWCSGTLESGEKFRLMIGAGLGDSRMIFSIGGAQYVANVRCIVDEFMEFREKEQENR